ncbi:pitrilysin family protein [Luteococcus peritonei]|uniref:Pitrilysin family protein n=1 Tax=Luteococcus peritonei TaxID=88874 RepID=A0ABW4RWY0_9ACTN
MSNAPERPEVRPAEGWQFPAPRIRSLDNGLQVWVFQLPGQHVVSCELVMDIPLSVEPAELEGVATLALRCSDEGTAAHPGEQLVEALESCGAAYEGHASASATIASLDLPSTRLEQALPLFAEIVRTPSLADGDVERHVALRLAEIEQTLASPPSLAALAVRHLLFEADSRETRPQGGRARTVERVDPAAVRDFHARWWRPEGATLVLAGDLGEQVDELVDRCFADWQGVEPRASHLVPLPASLAGHDEQGRRIVNLVDSPGAVQAELRVAGLGVDRSNPQFGPLQVAATAMGGSFGSRLNTLLREERGYTYGAHCSVAPARLGGTWAVSTSVRNECAVEALTDTLQAMELDEEGFVIDEVADAVSYLVGIAPLRYDTAGAISGQAASLAAAGWTPDFVNLHFARVAKVTPSAATQAWRQVMAPERSHVVVVGDAAQLAGPLESAGYAAVPLEAAELG